LIKNLPQKKIKSKVQNTDVIQWKWIYMDSA